MVSELFAKTNFGDENPIGRRLIIGGRDPRETEIVGVANEARYGGLKESTPPVVYIPYNQGSQRIVSGMTFELRTTGNPLGVVNTVRKIVRQADPLDPVTQFKTQTGQIDESIGQDESISQEVAFAKLCTAFAVLAPTTA